MSVNFTATSSDVKFCRVDVDECSNRTVKNGVMFTKPVRHDSGAP